MGARETGAGTLRGVDDTPETPPGDTPGDTPGAGETPQADDTPQANDIVIPAGHPGVPGRGAVMLAFAGVVVAGVLGGMIGYGLADIMCDGDCGPMVALGTLVGAALAAAGVGVVAVLVLRAMVEWKRTPPPDRDGPPANIPGD